MWKDNKHCRKQNFTDIKVAWWTVVAPGRVLYIVYTGIEALYIQELNILFRISKLLTLWHFPIPAIVGRLAESLKRAGTQYREQVASGDFQGLRRIMGLHQQEFCHLPVEMARIFFEFQDKPRARSTKLECFDTQGVVLPTNRKDWHLNPCLWSGATHCENPN